MDLSSPAFEHLGAIPPAHGCEGANLSPPLTWSGLPEGTAALLLTCTDPDAWHGVFHHWAAYNIPPTLHGAGQGERIGTQAVNDFGRMGYGGPCPPRGDRPHRYVFRLTALSGPIEARAGTGCAQIIAQAKPLEMAHADLIGLYTRRSEDRR
ncbi:MAG: YbhB/YbcL family Raf kinase inhibitor-like protein [Paracoccaceae bacterium]|nr:YbhB/YbcL family Raf kinase inhibitor-like protein [Paracoccaceae bacterium]